MHINKSLQIGDTVKLLTNDELKNKLAIILDKEESYFWVSLKDYTGPSFVVGYNEVQKIND